MLNQNRETIQRHIKTHTELSDMDNSAVKSLENFLKSEGKINTNFAARDKWPNTDGTFEFVSEPEVSRQPDQNFFVQIKGTDVYTESNGEIKYSLKSLAFPAFICLNVTLDPGILFVVLNPRQRGCERIFWKYMSAEFLDSIDFEKDSKTITFTSEEEILYTDESIEEFCGELEKIMNHHSFLNQLERIDYTKEDVKRIIRDCNEDITESIDKLDIIDNTRDGVSRRILKRLRDLCTATLLLNAMEDGRTNVSLQLAWEKALLNVETKYLATFLRGLQYIGNRVPDDGQSERLMLKYYNFLWQIRSYLQEKHGIFVLDNLEKFPLHIDELDRNFYELVAKAVDSVGPHEWTYSTTRYYVQKKTPFFVGKERYYEITLQHASIYATKFNRITVYTKKNISTSYSIQIGYADTTIELWGVMSNIKVVTDWSVAISAPCLNKLGKVLNIGTNISSKYGEYNALMKFLTETGINILDLIDLQEVEFKSIINSIYSYTNTDTYKEVLLKLRKNYSKNSAEKGKNVVRYLIQNLREEYIERVMPSRFKFDLLCNELYLSSRCFPFDKNPFLSDLAGGKTSDSSHIKHILNAVGSDKLDVVRPYLFIKNAISQTGEIYFDADSFAEEEIKKYNQHLDNWERNKGYKINVKNGYVSIDSYEKSTLHILKKLIDLSCKGNKGQKEYNQTFIKNCGIKFSDNLKEQTLREAFVNSHVLLIYGAAGTGKTTLINYISNMMGNRSKLFLTKTHTALQNMKRRIENPGTSFDFVSINSFTKKVSLQDYDIIFVDECSTIDNRTMQTFLDKLNPNTFLVLAGDIHQIESIEFGNWFFYAKNIINVPGSNVELLKTWRTEEQVLISLWNEVRNKDALLTEKLVIDGPFSENLGENVFKQEEKDEVVLCLNYDGKFGLNNINRYFQNANPSGEAVSWHEWTYKVGDRILFNETKRFSLLYNNLKGKIVAIEKGIGEISFTIDVDILLTQVDCQREEIEFIDSMDDGTTRIRITVCDYDDSATNVIDERLRIKSIIPFQLAYAVSIHKAQGLEYDSVKVIIPNNIAERITHGIFYTAITRAKKKLKIYWSSETMEAIIKGFSEEEKQNISLQIVKSKLATG